MEENSLIYVVHESGNVFFLEKSTKGDGSLNLSFSFKAAIFETREDIKQQVLDKSGRLLVEEVNHSPFYQTQLRVWERHSLASSKDLSKIDYFWNYDFELIKFDLEYDDYIRHYGFKPCSPFERELSEFQREHEKSLFPKAYTIADSFEKMAHQMAVSPEKNGFLLGMEVVMCGRSDGRQWVFDDQVAAIKNMKHRLISDPVLGDIAKDHLTRRCQKLVHFSKKYKMEDHIPNQIRDILEEYIPKKEKVKGDLYPIMEF